MFAVKISLSLSRSPTTDHRGKKDSRGDARARMRPEAGQYDQGSEAAMSFRPSDPS